MIVYKCDICGIEMTPQTVVRRGDIQVQFISTSYNKPDKDMHICLKCIGDMLKDKETKRVQ